MIIFGPESLGYIRRRDSVGENIVNGLDMEGLLDLSIRRDEEMEENHGRNQDDKDGD